VATTIRTIIVDDEPLARKGVRLELQKHPEFVIMTECADGSSALTAIRKHRPDLVFLDIQMPQTNGFELLEGLKADELPLVVFVTAYDSYALKAFDVHALDYVLKPIDPARFAETLKRVKSALEGNRAGEIGAKLLAALSSLRSDLSSADKPAQTLHRFVIREVDRVYFVPLDDVDWIESADYYVKLHCGKNIHLLRETLAQLEGQLDPRKFVRIHRSIMVRVDRIKEIRRRADQEPLLFLVDGTELQFGRTYRDKLDELIRTDRRS
jgi:two-component system, LytTR family, response regulator